MDILAFARYPFLPEASRYVAEAGPSLEELLGDPVYARVRRQGRERLVAAIRDGALPNAPLGRGSSEADLVTDLLSYGVSRILVSLTKDAYVVRRHALAEAVRVKASLDVEDDPEVVVAAAEDVQLRSEPHDGGFRMHFTDFLRLAVHLKAAEWKLVNRPLDAGFLVVPQKDLSRLVQEALRRRIESELPRPVSDDLGVALKEELAAVIEEAKTRKDAMQVDAFGEVDLALLPPCMKHILGQLQRGENAAHSARFAITSFLHAIGMTSDEIMKLFSTAPDFREDMTRYQVEHITGKTSGTEYSPPGCQAMKTYGICYNEDAWCRMERKDGSGRYVNHPISYYKWAVKRKARDAPRPAPAP